MKVTKRQLRRIIQEEKSRFINEVNPDGTISADEEDLEDELTYEVVMELRGLITRIELESEKIGGGFRSPGIRKRILKAMAEELHRAR